MENTPHYTAPGILTVDLKAVAANYRFFRKLAGANCAVAGIVKANAYGLGMTEVAPVLEREGCRYFFVATLEEGISLRSITKQPVFILGGLWAGAEREYHAYDLIPILNSLEEIGRWTDQAKWVGQKLSAILHFDTGMNRLGLGPHETERLLADVTLINGLDLRFVMSHFACADEKDHRLTKEQTARFESIAKAFPQTGKSLANSSGILRDRAYHYDLVRPGMAVYGLNPIPEQDNPMRPTVQLDTRLLQVRRAVKGETVGYGATHHFEKDHEVGTVALGYADGFSRAGGNRAVLYHNGKPCPVIGRVSMDLVTVDLSNTKAAPGDRLEILGEHQDADILAASMGTIGYEVLTGLGPRWARRYTGG